jgi:aspartyl-tRNA(Asn)/glutamyl-tRNA(Gln) amidotransferase subunit A
MSLFDYSILELRSALLKGEFSAKELTLAHLERAKEKNSLYNSFVTITEESAIKAAENADKIIREQGKNSPLMCGIPVSIKDLIITKGIKTTAGSKLLENFISPYNATSIKKLNASSAVIIGKTNLDEFGMGSSNEHSAFGAALNPWDTTRVPGGTSGGSAISVLTGQSAVSLGTDTGGSVRQPAAFCGVLGLKPTYGRVSRYGLIAHASSFDQIGPIGRTAEDLAITLQTIAGKDEKDSTSVDINVPNYLEDLQRSEHEIKGLRVGVPKEYLASGGLQKEVSDAFNQSLKKLGSLGATIVEISLPHTQYALACYYITTPAEASSNLSRYDGVRYGFRAKADSLEELYKQTRSQGFGREVKRRILLGTYVLSKGYYDAYYKKAQKFRTLIINDFKAAFANYCDVIATPAAPTTAFKLGEKTSSPLEMYLADIFTVPANIAGIPGISLPCGLDTNGLPIGLQLLAPFFKESRLLQTANLFLKEQPFDSSQFRKN